MHEGRVLICGEPQQLVEARAANSLEDAFIGYLQEAIGPTTTPPETSTEAGTASSPPQVSQQSRPGLHGFSLNRLFGYSHLEMIEVIRDPVRMGFALLGSAILLIVIAYGISLDVEDLSYAALDLDATPESRQYLSNFQGSRYFVEQPPIHSKEELDRRLQSNDITLAIEIPPYFGRALRRGDTPTVSAWIDGANTTRAGTIEGYVTGVHAYYLAQYLAGKGIDASSITRVSLEPRYRYNPSFETIYSIGPKTPAMLLLLIPAILMAVSMAREKEIGTITNFHVTPTTRLEFLIGKQLPYIAIGMVNFVILTLLVVFLLQVPLKGSLLALSLGALLYVSASTGFGLLVSSLTNSQVAAVFATTILTLLPTIMFSGFIQPTSTLEGGGRLIGTVWPATYYMHLSVATFTKGLGFLEVSRDLALLALFGPAFVATTALFLRKQET